MKYTKFYKNTNFAKFAEYINLGFLECFKTANTSRIQTETINNQVVFNFDVFLPLAPKSTDYFFLLERIRTVNPSVKFNITFKINSYSLVINEAFSYINYVLDKSLEFKHFKKKINNETVKQNTDLFWDFNYFEKIDTDEIGYLCEYLTTGIRNLGFYDFLIKPKYIELVLSTKELEARNKKLDEEYKKKLSIQNSFSQSAPTPTNSWKRRSKSYTRMKIHDMFSFDNENQKPVATNGVVYKSNYAVSPTKGKHIYTFFITDYDDAIELKWIRDTKIDNQSINVGDTVNVLGSIGRNMRNQAFIFIDEINTIENVFKKPEDKADVKRVELNTKSKMNTMDGILTPTEIVNNAKYLGHSAVALLDSDGVQGFPEFAAAAKKANIKPIYGVTFNAVEQSNMAIYGTPNDQMLRDTNYVVLDTETTSLSPIFGEIIEFGASIIENGRIVKKEQFFVKPKAKIKSHITNLTRIKQETLDEQGLEPTAALERIFKILDGKVAVAHNAAFDYSFILQKFKDHNMAYPNTTFIDSMVVSRIIFNKKSKHKLKDYLKYCGITTNENEAHRADYDANVLASGWIASLSKLEELKIFTINDLHNYVSDSVYNNRFASKISVIAKNQEGLKELFNLVSLSLTKRFFNSPKIFLEDIKKSNNILIGSGTVNGFLFDSALYRCEEKVDKLFELYDYIEIPSVSNFKNKIGESDFSEEEIKGAIKLIYKKAIEKNKLVVAVGDVRYLEPKDKIAYEMLVYAKGIGGDRHFLYDFRNPRELRIPDFHYKTTNEMLKDFEFLGTEVAYDLVVKNTNKFADMIEKIQVIKDKLYTPKFDNSKVKLTDLVYKTAKKIYGENLPSIVEERIKKEIEPITKYGYDVVYWISHILTKKSTDNGYLVGSRGSVGSSIVATLANITEVNPLRPHYVCSNCQYFELCEDLEITSGYDLNDKLCPNCKFKLDKDGQTIPFETFLGFEADKVPDIDLNFSGEYQSEIHNEVRRLFGSDHTYRAGTIATAATKTSYGYIKNAVEEGGKNISESFIDYLTTKIEGVKRTTGQHPGGIIIIPKEFQVEDFTPINFPADDIESDWKTTHFDFHAIHDNVLKLDILGHDDPTAIRMLERLTGLDVKKDIAKKDEKVMSIFSSPEALGIKPDKIGGEKTGALGIPEFGTPFVRKMLEQSKPRTFADLVSISGLSHGTDVWINNAQKLIVSDGLTLKDTISCRDDIMVNLIKEGVDPLFAFKIMEQVRKGNGVSEDQEKSLRSSGIKQWYIDSMRKIKYMFPKAHATAYVIMAWRIAWFKVYKPLEYYATYFTTRTDVFDISTMINDKNSTKVNKRLNEILNKANNERSVKENNLISTLELTREMYARGFNIENISLDKSLESEWIIDYENKCLIPPFSTIDGLGYNIAISITKARNEAPFISKEDFSKRTSVNKTQLKLFEDLDVFKSIPDSDQNTLFFGF